MKYTEAKFISVALDHLHRHEGDQAVLVLNKASQEYSDSWEVWRWLGASLDAIGEREKALDAYAKAVSINPTRISPYYHQARVLIRAENRQRAERLLQDGLAKATDTENDDYLLAQGALALMHKAWVDAERYYNKARDGRQPEDTFLYSVLSETLFQQGKFQESKQMLMALTKNGQATPNDLRRLGIIEKQEGNYDEAKRILLNVLGELPNDTSVMKALAQIALRQFKLIEAWTYLRRIVSIEN